MICNYCGKEIEKGNALNLLVKSNCCCEECKAKIHDEVVKAVNGGRNSKEKKQSEKAQNEANEKRKTNIYEEISAFAERQRNEIKKEKKTRKKQVCIDPDTIIGKEIMYQTALLQEILHEVRNTAQKEKVVTVKIRGCQEYLEKVRVLTERTEQLNKLMEKSVELKESLGL